MTINDVINQVYKKQNEIIARTGKVAKLSIYIGEELYQQLNAQIKGECSYAVVSFYQDDVILGYPVYRVINHDRHFKIIEDLKPLTRGDTHETNSE